MATACLPNSRALLCAAVASTLVCACSSGSDAPAPAPAPPPFVFPPTDASARVSAPSGLSANCGGALRGTLYTDAEVEPHVAANPANIDQLVGAWQQNRFSNGGSQAIFTARSGDGGVTWSRTAPAFSRCSGGTAGNGGDYERATDPWVSFAPDGTAYAMALAFTGDTFASGSVSAMLVVRSTDAGLTWSDPVTLQSDAAGFFNDKNSLTADPTDAALVYAVWDRLVSGGGGPTFFARTTDGGAHWEPARPIFDPGAPAQTLGNEIAVVANGADRGTLVNFFSQLSASGGGFAATLRVIRSADHGATWSLPITVNSIQAIGAADPQTLLAVRDGSGLAQVAAAPNGALYAVWQDARTSGGQVDGILFTRSTDAGLTWSPPVQINAVPATQAFTPSVHVRADGTVGVTYYDFRSDTADRSTLPTELWLTVSNDGGATWSESRVAGPFDLLLAPSAGGLFLGDYQGLTSVGTAFVPFFAQTTRDGAVNRNDIFSKPLPALARGTLAAQLARAPAPGTTFAQRVSDNLARVIDARQPGRARAMLERARALESP